MTVVSLGNKRGEAGGFSSLEVRNPMSEVGRRGGRFRGATGRKSVLELDPTILLFAPSVVKKEEKGFLLSPLYYYRKGLLFRRA